MFSGTFIEINAHKYILLIGINRKAAIQKSGSFQNPDEEIRISIIGISILPVVSHNAGSYHTFLVPSNSLTVVFGDVTISISHVSALSSRAHIYFQTVIKSHALLKSEKSYFSTNQMVLAQ